MSRRTLTLLAVGLAFAVPVSAQVRHPGIPASEWAPLPDDVPTSVMETPDLGTLMAEDDARGHWPLRYGAVIQTELPFDRVGRWDVAPDGSAVWRLRVTSPGAYSVGIVFDEYVLPDGAMVFLYDETHTDVFGAFTSANNKANGQLGVDPVPGDSVIIEYVQPARVQEDARLSVGQVIHDYRDVYSIVTGGGGISGGSSCLIDINCPEGDPYQVIKRASFRTLAGGALCTGGLLNNTAQDGTPYFLTAQHCGNMTNGTFWFNYERPNCDSGSASFDSVSGATQLASSGTFDSQLYRMSDIPGGHNPFFAGWDRTAQPTSGPAVSIGHGNGAPKQIAIDNTGASTGGNFFNAFWHEGIFVGGNSGGPLFDGNQRVIGPACCVNNFSCGSQSASFGRFNRFWNSSSISNFLDPTGSGATQLDGLDPNDPGAAPSLTSVTPGTITALEGGTLSIHGNDLFGITSVQLGGKVLGPGEFMPVNSFLVEVLNPLFENLGSVPVSVTNTVGTSNSVNVTVTDTDPPLITAPALSVPGLEWRLQWGGLANDAYFVNWSLDTITTNLMGFDVLANGNFGLSGSLSPAGTDEFVIPEIGSLGFLNLYFQVLTFDDLTSNFVGASNIATTLFL